MGYLLVNHLIHFFIQSWSLCYKLVFSLCLLASLLSREPKLSCTSNLKICGPKVDFALGSSPLASLHTVDDGVMKILPLFSLYLPFLFLYILEQVKVANSNMDNVWTGVSPGEGTGATMSDDEDDQADSDTNLYDGSLDGPDSMGFGPLIPTESERSLMERVRQELKHELKQVRMHTLHYYTSKLPNRWVAHKLLAFQGYKEKIVDIREEILRKRRAGKLPGDTTSLLKSWWQSHSKWPYPTVGLTQSPLIILAKCSENGSTSMYLLFNIVFRRKTKQGWCRKQACN